MVLIEDIHAILNILLASFVATFLTRFWTRDRLRESLDALQDDPRRWDRGTLLLTVGIVLQMPGTLWLHLRPHPVLSTTTVLSFPFFLAGVYLMYAATHPGDDDASAEGTG